MSLKSNKTAHWCNFLMNSCGRSLGGISGGNRYEGRERGEVSGPRGVLTHERREFFDFDLFGDNKPTASLFTWRFTDDRDSIFRTGSETV